MQNSWIKSQYLYLSQKPQLFRQNSQKKEQPNNASKILEKLPDIRIISLYIIKVKNSKNNKGKDLKETIDEIAQGAILTTTTMT